MIDEFCCFVEAQREQLIREVEIIPLEVVVRNVAAGSLVKRLGLEAGTQLPRSIIEFYYKNDQLNDPMVSEEHITAFGWATPQEIDRMAAVIREAMDAGAVGFASSTSPAHNGEGGVPMPSRLASDAEHLALIEAMAQLAGAGGEAGEGVHRGADLVGREGHRQLARGDGRRGVPR